MRGRRGAARRAATAVTAVTLAAASLALAPAPAGAGTNETPPTVVESRGIAGSGVPGTPQFLSVNAIAVDAAGDVFVAEDQIVRKLSAAGVDLTSWPGSSAGRELLSLTLGGDGHLYAIEDGANPSAEHRVLRFDSSGQDLGSFTTSSSAIDIAVDPAGGIFVVTHSGTVLRYAADGTPGPTWSASTQSLSIALDSTGAVYVGDDANNRVMVFDGAGTLLRTVGGPGSGDGQFGTGGFAGLRFTLDAADHLYVTDGVRQRVQEFDTTGAFVGAFGAWGTGDGRFDRAHEVAVGPDGHIWVTDVNRRRLTEFGAGAHAFVRAWGSFGDGGPQFQSPRGIATDGAGNIYVADTGNDRIQKFDAAGTLLLTWGSTGSGPDQLDEPIDVDVAGGSVYVSDNLNDRIQVFSTTGVHQRTITTNLTSPGALDVMSDGTVVVVDNKSIDVFGPTGIYLRNFGFDAANPITGVAIAPDGAVLAAKGSVVQRWSLTGSLLGSWDMGAAQPAVDARAVEVDPQGEIWVSSGVNYLESEVVKLRPDGTVLTRTPVVEPGSTHPSLVRDFAFGPDRRVYTVASSAIVVLQAATGPVLDTTLIVDQTTATVGDRIDYHVTIRNTGTVPLTGVSVTDAAAPDCSGPVPDLAVGAVHVVDCGHVAVPADVGVHVNQATVSTDQGAAADTNAVSVLIGAVRPATLVRTDTGVAAGGVGIAASADGGYELAVSRRLYRYGPDGAPQSNHGTIGGFDVARGPTGDHFVAGYTTTTSEGPGPGVVRQYTPAGDTVRTYVGAASAGNYRGVDVDEQGRVYVTEGSRTVCLQYDQDPWSGNLNCESWGTTGASRLLRFAADGTSSDVLATPGSGAGQLSQPIDVAVHDDVVHVADQGNNRVATFTADGTFVRNLPAAGVSGVAVGPDDTLYAVSVDGTVRAFGPDGTLRSAWVAEGVPSTRRVDVDGAGRVLILNANGRTVQVFEPVGHVAGTVTDVASSAPVAHAWVAALRTSDFSLAGAATAAADGSYVLDAPPGSYFLYLVDPAARHANGFAGGNAPPTVAVTTGATTAADATMAPTRGSITGVVTDEGSGQPIPTAVALSLSASGEAQRLAVGDGSGAFTLADQTAGNHLVAFLDPSGGHRPEFFDGSIDAVGATPVTVTAGGSTTASASLVAQPTPGSGATISGTVTEAGSGDLLAGVAVVVLRASDFAFVRASGTGPSGTYTVPVPAAESYKIAFLDTTGAHATEWHADRPFHALGSADVVVAPATVDAALGRTTGAIEGTVTDAGSGDPLGGAWVVAIGPSGIAGGAITAADGTYHLGPLPPHDYRVTVVDVVGGRPQEYWEDSSDHDGATPVAVTAAQTTSDIAPVLG